MTAEEIMNHLPKRYAALSAMVLVLTFGAVHAQSSAGWGEVIGPIAGKVIRGDDRRGLTVRSSPSYAAVPFGHIAVGTTVHTYGEFTDGWVRIASPLDGGWVEMSTLSPMRGTAVVVGVDLPENCLRIRSGPGSSYAVAGCAARGESLRLTGLWSETNWAQIDRPTGGWVYSSQIGTNLVAFRSPPVGYPSGSTGYVQPPEVSVYTPGFSYVYPRPRYYGPYKRYPYRHYSRPYRPHYPYRRYGSPGVAVGVGPRGVGVRAGGVGVRVGPGGVRVRVR